MKLAYIAYDQNALKAVPAFEKYFPAIDIYLLNPGPDFTDMNFLSLPVLAQNLRIPAEGDLRTVRHLQVLKELETEYAALKYNIYGGVFKDEAGEALLAQVSRPVLDLNSVEQVAFGRSRKPQILTTKNPAPAEYDHLIVQEHPLVGQALDTKGGRLFKSREKSEYAMLSLVFSFGSPLGAGRSSGADNCILVGSTAIKTIIDNWYICRLTESEIGVSFWVPEQALQKPGYDEFITGRIRELVRISFPEFAAGELLSLKRHSGGGPGATRWRLRYPQVSSVFPGFNYWSETQAQAYVHQFLIDKKIAPKESL